MRTIFKPTIDAMNAEGRSFKGCLYFGLMLTENGPKVIEYNCRFGDPETQVVLPLLETDLLTIMKAVADERLGELDIKFKDKAACCVVMASKGYPEKYDKGFEITMDSDKMTADVFVAGAKYDFDNEKLFTNGGRVLGVTAIADNLPAAIKKAYENVGYVHFENAYWRKDIGQRGLKALEEK